MSAHLDRNQQHLQRFIAYSEHVTQIMRESKKNNGISD